MRKRLRSLLALLLLLSLPTVLSLHSPFTAPLSLLTEQLPHSLFTALLSRLTVPHRHSLQ